MTIGSPMRSWQRIITLAAVDTQVDEMKVTASHTRHIRNKKLFNQGKAYLETQRKVIKHVSKKKNP